MYLQCRTLRIFEIKLCLSALSSVARYAWNFRHWLWKENKSIIIVFLFLFTESALTPKFDLLEFFLKTSYDKLHLRHVYCSRKKTENNVLHENIHYVEKRITNLII